MQVRQFTLVTDSGPGLAGYDLGPTAPEMLDVYKRQAACCPQRLNQHKHTIQGGFLPIGDGCATYDIIANNIILAEHFEQAYCWLGLTCIRQQLVEGGGERLQNGSLPSCIISVKLKILNSGHAEMCIRDRLIAA